jgi:hypothetical protein
MPFLIDCHAVKAAVAGMVFAYSIGYRASSLRCFHHGFKVSSSQPFGPK